MLRDVGRWDPDSHYRVDLRMRAGHHGAFTENAYPYLEPDSYAYDHDRNSGAEGVSRSWHFYTGSRDEEDRASPKCIQMSMRLGVEN